MESKRLWSIGAEIVMNRIGWLILTVSFDFLLSATGEELYPDPINVHIAHVSTDPSIRYDYDIVYVRAPRSGDEIARRFYTDFSQPLTMEPGADLMLLHPDGTEELLVPGGN